MTKSLPFNNKLNANGLNPMKSDQLNGMYVTGKEKIT